MFAGGVRCYCDPYLPEYLQDAVYNVRKFLPDCTASHRIWPCYS